VTVGIGEAVALPLAMAIVGAGWVFERGRRRRAEAEAREHEAQRAIVNEAPVMIWRTAVDKHCDFVNPSWLAFTGRALSQELGNGWLQGVHPDDRAGCFHSYETAFDARLPCRMEYRLRRFEGEYRWVLDLGTPRYDSTGEFAGYIGCCFDITDWKQAERALELARAEITRVSRLTALGEYAAALSHELRQPLAAMIMNASAGLSHLDHGTHDHEALREIFADVVRAGHRAEEVIRRNRELFRHQGVQTSALDINAVVGEVLVLSAARLREWRVLVDTELADDLPLVSGDRIELLQVLLNLLGNAIDAMEAVAPFERRITITTSRLLQSDVVIGVKDRGAGLGGVDMQRLFTLSYTTKAAGTGVGLSVSRAIVHAHGGRIWASPNPDRGATFSFTLPVRESRTLPPEASERDVQFPLASAEAPADQRRAEQGVENRPDTELGMDGSRGMHVER
jgi:PAS domain S-box-containing protein